MNKNISEWNESKRFFSTLAGDDLFYSLITDLNRLELCLSEIRQRAYSKGVSSAEYLRLSVVRSRPFDSGPEDDMF
jgi:hypothetical protein